MSGDYPKTPDEWSEVEKKIAQEEQNRKNEALQKILVPDAGKKDADKALTADFLDRPGLKIQVYRPTSTGGVALPGEPCTWSDSFEAPRCGQQADFIIIDTISFKGAPLCRDHALQAAKERKAKAQDAAARLRAERNQRKLENWRKRQP